MNKKILFFWLIIAALVVSACNSEGDVDANASSTDQEKVVLKLATHEAPGAFFSATVTEPFMEKVTEKTDGQVEFEFYPSQQLGNVADYLDLTSKGVTDIAFYIASYTADQMPYSSTINSIPGLVTTSNQGSNAFHKLLQTPIVLETDYLSNGVRPIVGYTTSSYDFWGANELIKAPEDLEGKQIRGSGALMNEIISFFGASPVTVPTPDLYEAVEKGIVDGAGQYATTLDSFGVGEVINHGSQGVRFGSGAAGLIMNEEKWQSLPENVQKAIQEAANEVVESGSQADDEQNEKIVAEWSETKDIYSLSKQEKEAWDKKYDEFYAQWIDKQDAEMAEVIETYKELLEE